MTNVTFALAVKHWRTSLLIAILVKYFGLILLLGGIVKTTRKSSSNRVIFYLLFIPEKSLLGINYLLVARNTFTFRQKMRTLSVLIPTSLF